MSISNNVCVSHEGLIVVQPQQRKYTPFIPQTDCIAGRRVFSLLHQSMEPYFNYSLTLHIRYNTIIN